MVDPVRFTAAYAHNAAILYTNIQSATIRAEYAGRLYPLIWFFSSVFIYPCGPICLVRSAFAPDIFNAVAGLFHILFLHKNHSTPVRIRNDFLSISYMKIRIQGNSLRFRLKQYEVASFKEKKIIQ